MLPVSATACSVALCAPTTVGAKLSCTVQLPAATSANGYTVPQVPPVRLIELAALTRLIPCTLTVATASKLLRVTVRVAVEPITVLPKSMEAGVAMSACAANV